MGHQGPVLPQMRDPPGGPAAGRHENNPQVG